MIWRFTCSEKPRGRRNRCMPDSSGVRFPLRWLHFCSTPPDCPRPIRHRANAAARGPASAPTADVVVRNTGRWNDRAAKYSCGKANAAQTELNVLRQPDYGRRMNRQLCRMQHMAVVLFNAGDPFKDHYHCAPFVAHIDGLKRSIQY